MKKRDFMKQEFIGLEAEVIASTHHGYRSLRGRIVNETKNTIVIEHEGKAKTVPKTGNEFLFTYGDEKIAVRGSEIRHRPEDRIKKTR
jgi:ribonuclease P protein subunit POP4